MYFFSYPKLRNEKKLSRALIQFVFWVFFSIQNSGRLYLDFWDSLGMLLGLAREALGSRDRCMAGRFLMEMSIYISVFHGFHMGFNEEGFGNF